MPLGGNLIDRHMIGCGVPQSPVKTDDRRPGASETLDHAAGNLRLALPGLLFCLRYAVLLLASHAVLQNCHYSCWAPLVLPVS